MKKTWKIALTVCFFIYPVFIFLSLVVFELDISVVGLGMLVIAGVSFFVKSGKDKVTPIVVGLAAIIFFITKKDIIIKFYPIWMTATIMWIFLSPLIKHESIIFFFAKMWDKSIEVHPGKTEIEHYCYVWNWIWVSFFVLSEIINVTLLFNKNNRIWAVYNGLISYLIQGLMFTIQFGCNYFYNKRIDSKYGFNRKIVREELKKDSK